MTFRPELLPGFVLWFKLKKKLALSLQPKLPLIVNQSRLLHRPAQYAAISLLHAGRLNIYINRC